MLQDIESTQKRMTRAEKKLARVVLVRLYRVLRKSIGLLASESGASEPTVMRFCRMLKCTGFQDFKPVPVDEFAAGRRFLCAD